MVFDLNEEIGFKERLFYHLGSVAPLATNFLQRTIDVYPASERRWATFFSFLGLVYKTYQGRSWEAMVLVGHDVFRLYPSNEEKYE